MKSFTNKGFMAAGVFALLAIILLTFVGAGGGEAPIASVSLALSGNPSTLDPHATTETLTFQVTKSLYDTLIDTDADGNIIPGLAESWTVSSNGMEILFNLRKDVTFQDGSRFTSRDVKASLERILDPDVASPSAGEFSVIDSIELLDDYTVRLVLSEPSAPLLFTLASGWAAMLPAAEIASGRDFSVNPLGTGPFSLTEWTQDEKLVLAKNPDYYIPGKPSIDEIQFRVLPESSVQVQALMSRQVDILYLISEEDLPILESSGHVDIVTLNSALVLVMSINTSRDILGEVDMRRALNYAINKQAALDVAYGGGTVIGSFNDPTSPFYVDFSDRYAYDPEMARELAAEAGYDESRVFDLVLPQNFAPHVTAGELYQEMLREAGIQARIRMVDWSTWISDVYGNANYDLTVIGHTGKLDPDGRFIGYGSGDMYVRYENAELASLIEAGRKAISIAERREIYTRVQEIFADEVPFVYVGAPIRRLALNSRVNGFVMVPNLDTFDFRDVTVSAAR